MKKLFWSLFVLLCCAFAFGESDTGQLATRTMESDGDSRFGFTILAGSQSAVYPAYYDSASQDILARKHRTTLIENPSSNYDLFIGTWSGFSTNGPCWFVPRSSGTWTTNNHAKMWLLYPPGASSETVRGNIEAE